MDRRSFLLGSLIAFAASRAARAQQAGKVYHIGYLSTPSRESVQRAHEAFLRALQELGWVEGQNLIIDYRWAEGQVERLPDLAAELVRRKVDVIVAPAGSAALAAKNATSSIPIVMIFPSDPVEMGLVASLSRPGGNVTGTTFTPSREIFGKQLQILEGGHPARLPPFLCGSAFNTWRHEVRRSSMARSPPWRKSGRTRFWLAVPRPSWRTGPGSPNSR
jgi:putative tryptophan/tyrosine transport system substrate-binding protein